MASVVAAGVAVCSCASAPANHRYLDKLKLANLEARDSEVAVIVEKAAQDPDERFRALAMDTIARLGMAGHAELLRRSLQEDSSSLVQLHALSALVTLRGVEALPTLVAVLREDWGGENRGVVESFALAELCALDDAQGLLRLDEAAAQRVASECTATTFASLQKQLRVADEAKRRKADEQRAAEAAHQREAATLAARQVEREQLLRRANAALVSTPEVRVLLEEGRCLSAPADDESQVKELARHEIVDLLAIGPEWALVRPVGASATAEGWTRAAVLGTPAQALKLLQRDYQSAKSSQEMAVLSTIKEHSAALALRLVGTQQEVAARLVLDSTREIERLERMEQARAAAEQRRVEAQERRRHLEEERARERALTRLPAAANCFNGVGNVTLTQVLAEMRGSIAWLEYEFSGMGMKLMPHRAVRECILEEILKLSALVVEERPATSSITLAFSVTWAKEDRFGNVIGNVKEIVARVSISASASRKVNRDRMTQRYMIDGAESWARAVEAVLSSYSYSR